MASLLANFWHGGAALTCAAARIGSAWPRGPRLTVCDKPSSSWGMTPSRSFTCRPRAKCHPGADDGHDLAVYGHDLAV
jgi:hypothetical protein